VRIDADGTFRLPALASAHSHAFQRALRGQAQRPGTGAPGDDFWSWRRRMYALAASLTPESIHAISRVTFRELARAGVRTVGEFHYVHHDPSGVPYADRTTMADAVIRAAKDEGLRIALLRAAYHRDGAGRRPEGVQRRFCDPSVDAVLADTDALRARWGADPDVVIGLAPHSTRAVPPEWLPALASYAARHRLPIHMHVGEQAREIDECAAETGRRPVELLGELGVLSDRFVAVHLTNLLAHEARLLGSARALACICATTERDLGDGLPDLGALRGAGVRLCAGGDSHVVVDPIEDLRSLETHERLRTRRRVTFSPAGESPAEALWREGSDFGALACGFSDAGGWAVVRRDHPALELVEDDVLLDAVVFGAGSSIVDRLEKSPVPTCAAHGSPR
jgi:formimidoylglutamate deiminase